MRINLEKVTNGWILTVYDPARNAGGGSSSVAVYESLEKAMVGIAYETSRDDIAEHMKSFVRPLTGD